MHGRGRVNPAFHNVQGKLDADELAESLKALLRKLDHDFITHNLYTVIVPQFLVHIKPIPHPPEHRSGIKG